jgi:hypothetical protein
MYEWRPNVGMKNVRVPTESHVMDDIEVKRPEQTLDRSGKPPWGTNVYHVRRHPKRVNRVVTLPSHHVHLVPLPHQPLNETKRPDFGAAALRFERLEHNPNSHGSESPRDRERRIPGQTGLEGLAALTQHRKPWGGIMDERPGCVYCSCFHPNVGGAPRLPMLA